MTGVSWRVLAAGNDARTLLAVDFGPGRAAANFADLSANLDPMIAIWETVFAPATGDPAEQTDPARWVAACVDDVRTRERQVCGVLGFCAGAALAWQAASLLHQTGGTRPTAILIDPTAVDGALIRDLFAYSAQAYAELLPAAQCEAAVRAVARVTDDLGDDIALMPAPALAQAFGAVRHEYDVLVRAACHELGVGDEVGRGFTDRFSSYLGYLFTAGRAVGYRSDVVRPVIYASSDHQVPQKFGAVDRRFAVSRAEMLADPAVAEAVRAAIGDAAVP
jgi:hypothetical protein